MDWDELIEKYADDASGGVDQYGFVVPCTSYKNLEALAKAAWNAALEHAAKAFEAMPDGAEYGKDHAALAVRAMKVK